MTFDDGRRLLVLWLDKLIFQHSHTRNAFVFKCLETWVKGFLVKKKTSTDGKLFYTMPPKIYWYYRLDSLHKNSTPEVKANQKQTSTINFSCLVWISSCTLPVWWKVFALKTNRAPDHLTEQFLPCHLKHTNGATKFKTKAIHSKRKLQRSIWAKRKTKKTQNLNIPIQDSTTSAFQLNCRKAELSLSLDLR